jgi:hypothetical protein
MKIFLLIMDPDNGELQDVKIAAFNSRAAAERAETELMDEGSESIFEIRELSVSDTWKWNFETSNFENSPSPDPRESFEYDPHDLEDFGGRGVEPR